MVHDDSRFGLALVWHYCSALCSKLGFNKDRDKIGHVTTYIVTLCVSHIQQLRTSQLGSSHVHTGNIFLKVGRHLKAIGFIGSCLGHGTYRYLLDLASERSGLALRGCGEAKGN